MSTRKKQKYFAKLDKVEKVALSLVVSVLLFGAILAAGLNYLQTVKPKQIQKETISNITLQSFANIIKHHLNTVEWEVDRFINSDVIQNSLHNDDFAALDRYFSNIQLSATEVLAAKIYKTVPAALNTEQQDSVGYGVISLIDQALQGQSPAPEVHRVKKNLFLNIVLPLKLTNGKHVAALLTLSPNWLDEMIGMLDTAPGNINLEQLSTSGKHLLLASTNGVKIKHPDYSFKLNQPNWILSIKVNPKLFSPNFEQLKISIFVIICIFSMCSMLLLGLRRMLKLIESDLSKIKQSLLDKSVARQANYAFASKAVRNIHSLQKEGYNSKALQPDKVNLEVDSKNNTTLAVHSKIISQKSKTPSPELALTNPVFQNKFQIKVTEINASTHDETETNIPPEIFRAYDIRGIVGEQLNNNLMKSIGKAVAKLALEYDHTNFVVARDCRESSETFANSLIEGIRLSGLNVIDVGLVSSPMMYFAVKHLKTGAGAIITGSHNPKSYNGVKLILNDTVLRTNMIQQIYEIIKQGDFYTAKKSGDLTTKEITFDYIASLKLQFHFSRKLNIVVDAGNSVMGPIVSEYLHTFDVNVTPIYCDIDPSFPNHHPDPADADNLQALINKVKQTKADFGIAFDGDGDRIGLVDNNGDIIWPDQLLLLFAEAILLKTPKRVVIYDVKCTKLLQSRIKQAGGVPYMFKTGHTLIKHEIKQQNAVLAGEMSGHIFFNDRAEGVDDAFYAALRLCEIVAQSGKSLSDIMAVYPKTFNTPEIRVPVACKEKFKLVDKFKKGHSFLGAKLIDIDGLRVEYEDGWGLLRASNTTSDLVLRFEADTEEALTRIKSYFINELERILPKQEFKF